MLYSPMKSCMDTGLTQDFVMIISMRGLSYIGKVTSYASDSVNHSYRYVYNS